MEMVVTSRKARTKIRGSCPGKEPMNNDTSDGGATVPCISLFDVTDLCQREGIELRGDDGKPYCCGERMNFRGGIIGPDFAECRKCGKAIGNVASPHINGGYIPSDEWIKENGNKTWYVIRLPVD